MKKSVKLKCDKITSRWLHYVAIMLPLCCHIQWRKFLFPLQLRYCRLFRCSNHFPLSINVRYLMFKFSMENIYTMSIWIYAIWYNVWQEYPSNFLSYNSNSTIRSQRQTEKLVGGLVAILKKKNIYSQKRELVQTCITSHSVNVFPTETLFPIYLSAMINM